MHYQLLATYYDKLFASARAWSAVAREELLDGIVLNCESACDLACGTGTTAIELAQLGLKVYALDQAPGMCELAAKKAAKARAAVTVLRADMRRFRLPEPVDLVTCEFDAINHVPRKADLALVASSVARALKPGGHFYFDVNNRLAFRDVWPQTWRHEKPGLIVVMHGQYDAAEDRASTTAEFFVRHGKLWERHVERVQEVCWTRTEIWETLKAAGFGAVRTWDASRFFPPEAMIGRGHRTIYLARKNKRA